MSRIATSVKIEGRNKLDEVERWGFPRGEVLREVRECMSKSLKVKLGGYSTLKICITGN